MSRAATAPVGLGSRRDRLGRERTSGQLRREARLQAEVVHQLEPLLGPAGRPTGAAAMSVWRRRHVDAYLAMPPWRRAWRTWTAWARLQRAAAVVALTGAWTLVVLPLQLLGLAGTTTSQVGVGALLALAPVALLAPPRPRGRFTAPLPVVAGRWRGSRAARRLTVAGVGAACLTAAVVGIVVAAGAGGPSGLASAPPDIEAAAVRDAVATTCGVRAGVEVVLLRPGRYQAVLPGGAEVTVGMLRGRVADPAGQRARVVGGATACPAA